MANQLSPENSAARERARIRALFSSIGDGIVATDEEGNISEINSAGVRILGFHAQELLGQWFPRAIRAVDEDGEEIDLLDRPVTQAMVGGKPVAGRTFYITKTKQKIPVSITVSPILEDGRPVGVIEVFRDISHEYEVDRMKSEFISIASHQLRTPLTAVKTYSHMLADGFAGKLNHNQQNLMKIILGSVDRMNDLINTLLDVTRIEEGRISIDPKPIDLIDVIKEITGELSPMAKQKKIKIAVDAKGVKTKLNTDPLLIKEILANLLSNSVKYTPEKGSVNIKIADSGDSMAITVADTGYGIPRREQKRVFSKFFRAENVLDKEVGGTGLGLYLVKQAVEILGGKISFASEEGVGSSFQFTLPKV